MNNRSLICCKPSRLTPSRPEPTSHPAIPVGISDVSMRLTPTHRMRGEYSRVKVPNVLANSNAESQRPRRSRASRPRQTLRRPGRRGHSQFLSGTTAGRHCNLSGVPPCRLRRLTAFLLHSLWNWARLRGRDRRGLKDKDFAVSAAMLWSASSRCIESHRYPSCRS